MQENSDHQDSLHIENGKLRATSACPICQKQTTSVRRHLKNVHGVKVANPKVIGNFACECGVTFTRRRSLYRHRREQGHIQASLTTSFAETEPTKRSNRNCSERYTCQMCKQEFDKRHGIVEHFEASHPEMNVHVEERVFFTTDDFNDFKAHIESTQPSCFISQQKYSYGSTTCTYYRCSREHAEFDTVRRRQIFHAPCSAFFTVRECEDGVRVKFCTTHFGHALDAAHLPLLDWHRGLLTQWKLEGFTVDQTLVRCREFGPMSKMYYITSEQILGEWKASDRDSVAPTANSIESSPLLVISKEETADEDRPQPSTSAPSVIGSLSDQHDELVLPKEESNFHRVARVATPDGSSISSIVTPNCGTESKKTDTDCLARYRRLVQLNGDFMASLLDKALQGNAAALEDFESFIRSRNETAKLLESNVSVRRTDPIKEEPHF